MQANKRERETEKAVIRILEEFGKPVSIGYVAYNLKICWTTARGLLFRMSLNGKLKAVETSKGFFFSIKN
jgi:hypothetical protein